MPWCNTDIIGFGVWSCAKLRRILARCTVVTKVINFQTNQENLGKMGKKLNLIINFHIRNIRSILISLFIFSALVHCALEARTMSVEKVKSRTPTRGFAWAKDLSVQWDLARLTLKDTWDWLKNSALCSTNATFFWTLSQWNLVVAVTWLGNWVKWQQALPLTKPLLQVT